MAVKEPKIPASRREPEYVDKPSPFSIEGIRSGAVQSRVVKGMIVLSGLIMAGTFALSSLQPSGIPQAGQSAQQLASTVATVGSQSVTGAQLENAFARSQQMNSQFGQKTTVASYLGDKQGALKQLTNQAALVEAAQKANIQVSDAEIDQEIDKELRTEFKPQAGQTQAQFIRLVQARYNGASVEQAIAQERAKVPAEGREQVRQKLLVDKLAQQTKDATTATEDDYKRSVTKLDLYRILIRPEMPKGNSKDFQGDSARMATAARDKALKLFTELKANPTLANFKAVALKESNDFQTKAKGGSLGLLLPTQLPDPQLGEQLSRSAQNLVGPLTANGDAPGTQAIYFVASRKTDLPKDYEKNKTKLLADFKKSQGEAAWSKKQDELQKAITPQVNDPALAAFQLQSDIYTKQAADQAKTRAEVLADYDAGLKTAPGLEAAAINYQKSVIFRDGGKRPEQLDALKAATQTAKSDPALLLTYGQALRDGGQPKPALEQFQAASKALDDNPTPAPMFGGPSPDDGLRQQLAAQFDLLKEPKLAAAERARIKPARSGASPFGNLPPGVHIQPAPR